MAADRAVTRLGIIATCWSMKEGECFDIPIEVATAAFPANPLSGMPGIESLMENLPGYNFGEFIVREHPSGRSWRVERCSLRTLTGERVRTDWDRR
jgi:hypothetical protein